MTARQWRNLSLPEELTAAEGYDSDAEEPTVSEEPTSDAEESTAMEEISLAAEPAEEDEAEIKTLDDNLGESASSGYVLVNIPYDEFYSAELTEDVQQWTLALPPP